LLHLLKNTCLGFRHTAIGRTLTAASLNVMETVGMAPPGSTKVAKVMVVVKKDSFFDFRLTLLLL
jgi:hypothetical protein